MEVLIWIGAALTLIGILGLIMCILRVRRARRDATSDDEIRAELQKVVALNLGAMGVSAIGLMMVVLGVFLS